ncbi:hypothetical protein R1flu_000444 [Riccia fluitans]|uniref:Uncharacterized protein n=1 Tax=Riccia fluitans TaxID=41844 RepID=A0ABD1Y4M3_9MARC
MSKMAANEVRAEDRREQIETSNDDVCSAGIGTQIKPREAGQFKGSSLVGSSRIVPSRLPFPLQLPSNGIVRRVEEKPGVDKTDLKTGIGVDLSASSDSGLHGAVRGRTLS